MLRWSGNTFSANFKLIPTVSEFLDTSINLFRN